jgi:hypothetical protein
MNRSTSAGEGKARVLDEKQTTVYKRALNEQYHLKMKASRAIFSDISKRYPFMPFPLRKLLATSDASKRFGLVECMNHNLLQAYPVLWEKEGEAVAHIKGTVLLMKNGSDRVTLSPLQEHKSEKVVESEEIKTLLAQSIKSKKNKKKKGVGAAADGEAAEAE